MKFGMNRTKKVFLTGALLILFLPSAGRGELPREMKRPFPITGVEFTLLNLVQRKLDEAFIIQFVGHQIRPSKLYIFPKLHYVSYHPGRGLILTYLSVSGRHLKTLTPLSQKQQLTFLVKQVEEILRIPFRDLDPAQDMEILFVDAQTSRTLASFISGKLSIKTGDKF
jgi:hypothetical protein